MIQLTHQKEILKEMIKLDLLVVRQTNASEQLMVFQIQPTLIKVFKEAQKRDPMLQKFREQIEAGLRTYITIYLDGAIYFGNRICVSLGEIRQKVLAEAHNSAYSIHPGGTKMYHNLRNHF